MSRELVLKVSDKSKQKEKRKKQNKQQSDRQIIKERLPVGLFAFIGKQGSGKTSLAAAMLCNDFKYHYLERYEESKAFINELNHNGFALHLPKNKCLYFSPDPILLSKKHNIETWYIDPTKFKLPNLKEEVQLVPRGSVVFLPEFDNIINCRDWRNMSPYLIALAKYARHWDLTIIIDFQVWLRIDKSWRDLMMYTCFIYDSYWKDKWAWLLKLLHLPIKRVWNYLWCDNQLNAFVKDLSNMKTNKRLVKKLSKFVAKDKRYVFKGNIFTRYESTSGFRYFLRGIKDYEYISHEKSDISPEGIERYCQKHPLVRE